jgi:HAD superfamily hydrolase (TIGR01450 family)
VSFDLNAAVRRASGFIFDMDGTIALGDAASGGHKALPFALETIAAVKAAGIPLRVFTNGTAKPPATYAASLRAAGFDVADHEMMTPSTSAAFWLKRKGLNRVRVLGNAGCAAPLTELGLDVIGPSEPATGVDAVYTGWHREFAFPDLEAACGDIWAGAKLVTASNVPFFATATGRAIGASFPINAMIRSLTAKRALVLGKPSRIAFVEAARAMGIKPKDHPRVIIVGDDPALEMRMANTVGAVSIGLTTGMLSRDMLPTLPAAQRPDVILDSLAPLLSALN